MSTATADAADAPAPKAGGKKKLIIIIAAALILLLAGGGTALFLLKKKAAAAEEEALEEDGKPVAEAKHDQHDEKKLPPIFVPLDPFTVNLADRDAERYAQIGLTLEIDDAKVGDQLKLYMPAIRNNILMLLAHKTAGELLTREGKLLLAQEVRRETMLPLGINMPLDDEAPEGAAKKGKKASKKKPVVYPVKAVHFANIIIQ